MRQPEALHRLASQEVAEVMMMSKVLMLGRWWLT